LECHKERGVRWQKARIWLTGVSRAGTKEKLEFNFKEIDQQFADQLITLIIQLLRRQGVLKEREV